MSDSSPILVIGAGSWGTALAVLAAKKGRPVCLLTRRVEAAQQLSSDRENSQYLPGISFPEKLQVLSYSDPNLAEQLEEQDFSVAEISQVIFAIPSQSLRETTAQLQPFFSHLSEEQLNLLSCSKGIEIESGKRMSEILQEAYLQATVAVLSGPNHAEEIAAGLPAASLIACSKQESAQAWQEDLSNEFFRIYTSNDPVGVEWAGALKNIYALAAGISDGLQLGDNAKSALLSRSLQEMTRLGTAVGGEAATFIGLAGIGDLAATSFSPHSRNYQTGRKIAELAEKGGESSSRTSTNSQMVAEGVPNSKSIYKVARSREVSTPILDQVYEVLHQEKNPNTALKELFSRDLRSE